MLKFITKNYFHVFAGLLIIVAVLGIFDHQANLFVSEVAKKNLSFLALVSEIKLIFASVKGIQIPFISSSSEEISTSLGKAQNYLLLTNIVTFLQLLLLGISKSWMVKIGLIALFLLSILNRKNHLRPRLLLLILALNPGFSMYSVAIDQLSKEASVDFGNHYLTELKMQVNKVKIEKSKLMQEHAQEINRINNEQKGIVFLKKLKEDVSYDLKKGVESIKGDYTEIRLLFHEAGHTIVKKLFTFCTMILFYLFLLPIGYLLFIYFLYNSLFKTRYIKKGIPNSSSSTVSTLPFIKKATNIFKAVKQEISNKLHQEENNLTNLKAEFNQEAAGLSTGIADDLTHVEKKTSDYLKDKIQEEKKVASSLKSVVVDTANEMKEDASTVVENIHLQIDEVGEGKEDNEQQQSFSLPL